MKKIIKPLILVLGISILFLFIIDRNSVKHKNRKNGFVRKFSLDAVRMERNIALKNKQYAFMDVTDDQIRLYEFKKPYQILTLSTDLKKTNKSTLPQTFKFHKVNGMNSASYIGTEKFVLVGRAAMAYKSTSLKNTLDSSRLDSLPFYQSEVISPNSFIFLSKFKYNKENRRKLVKANWDGKQLGDYLLTKQFDGYLCNDGQFRYSKDSKLLVYLYYYRGGFVCLDTNLKVRYHANTIDTVRIANVQLKRIGTKMILAVPPDVVNNKLCVSGNKIFIQSNLKADNEESAAFHASEVIDVYDLINGKYSFSFNLPLVEKQKLKEFSVHKNKLIAIYNNSLAIFRIPEN